MHALAALDRIVCDLKDGKMVSTTRVQEYKSTRVQEYKSTRVQEYKSVQERFVWGRGKRAKTKGGLCFYGITFT
jgi:hypothetical protein